MLAKKRLDLARAAGNYQANTPSMRDGRTEKSPEPPVGHQARRTDRAAAGARKYFFEPNPNAKGQAMPKEITSDQVVAAAEGLGKAEFTRSDLAQKLGVEEPKEFSQGFRQARRAGRLDKVRDDEEGTGHFRLTDQ